MKETSWIRECHSTYMGWQITQEYNARKKSYSYTAFPPNNDGIFEPVCGNTLKQLKAEIKFGR